MVPLPDIFGTATSRCRRSSASRTSTAPGPRGPRPDPHDPHVRPGFLRETLTELDRPHRFGYRIDRVRGPMRPLVRHLDGAWAFEPDGAGTTDHLVVGDHADLAADRPVVALVGRMWHGYARQALVTLESILHRLSARPRFLSAAVRLLPFLLASPDAPGAVAQLVAHLVRNEGVRGSSPLSSTHRPPGPTRSGGPTTGIDRSRLSARSGRATSMATISRTLARPSRSRAACTTRSMEAATVGTTKRADVLAGEQRQRAHLRDGLAGAVGVDGAHARQTEFSAMSRSRLSSWRTSPTMIREGRIRSASLTSRRSGISPVPSRLG